MSQPHGASASRSTSSLLEAGRTDAVADGRPRARRIRRRTEVSAPDGSAAAAADLEAVRRRADALEIVRLTLDKMAAGGIYDHLGGGFHRYSTDARWLVPHFEKMLYDNALLSSAYLEAFQVDAGAALRGGRPRDDRLRAARNDRARRRLLQHAGRRQRRARRGSSSSGRRTKSKSVLGAEESRTLLLLLRRDAARGIGKARTFSIGSRRVPRRRACSECRRPTWRRRLPSAGKSSLPAVKSAFIRAATTKSSRAGTA